MPNRAGAGKQQKTNRPQLVRKDKGQQDVLAAEFRRHKILRIVAVICILAVVGWLFVAMFSPGLKYQLAHPITAPLDSPEFLRDLEGLTDARISSNNRIEALPNG